MPHTRRQFLSMTGATALTGSACGQRTSLNGADRPNIVLIYPDQLRSMALSLYGQTNIETPYIDSLLQSGTHFPLAITPNPVCTPARAATLFGRIPSTIGVEVNGNRPMAGVPSLANVLEEAGYHCGYIGKWHLDGNRMPGFVPPESRFGFRTWRAYNFHHNYTSGVYFEDDDDRPIQTTGYLPFLETELGLEFMAENQDQPFLLVLSYGPPHPSHSAPTSYRGDLPAEWFSSISYKSMNFRPNVPEWIIPYNKGPNGNSRNEVGANEYLYGYYAATRSIDECIRRLIQGIDDLGLTENTIICFASDHGDMAGSHGLFRKGVSFREASEVPLGFSWPGQIRARQSSQVPASLIDIAPTLVSLAGLAIPQSWHGNDLSPWLIGDGAPPPKSVFSEGGMNGTAPWELVRTVDWSLTVRRQDALPIALFDRINDPYEQVNLAARAAYSDIIHPLTSELMRWRYLLY